MILLIAATHREMESLLSLPEFVITQRRFPQQIETLVTGVGMLTTALTLERFCTKRERDIRNFRVIQFGIGGAYIRPDGAKMLDMCLAQREVLGDFGVCFESSITYFDRELCGNMIEPLSTDLYNAIKSFFCDRQYTFSVGTFITVQSVSGIAKRGDFFANHWNALCENMEGAAAARVCSEYSIDFAELRAISNMVEDRNLSRWERDKACERAASVIPALCSFLLSKYV